MRSTALMVSPTEQKVLARYSFWKVAVWVSGVGAFGVWFLYEGWSQGWPPTWPSNRTMAYAYLAMGGAPFMLLLSFAMAANFILHRGVAIAVEGDDLVVNLINGRRRLSLREHLGVDSDSRIEEAPYQSVFFKTPPVVVRQVALYQTGRAPLNISTGLMTEPAAVIAERIRDLRAKS